MYHLARSLYLRYTSKPEYSILLLGLDNAGKTTLLNQIKALFSTATTSPDPLAAALLTANTDDGGGEAGASTTAGNTVPTVGQNVATIDLPEMYLKMWDVGGQMTLRRLWTGYYSVCHAVVFVLDSSDLGSGGGVFDDAYADASANGDATSSTGGAAGTVGGRPGTVGEGGRGWQGGGARLKSFRKNSVLDPDGNDAEEAEGREWASAWPKTPTTPITPGMLLGGRNYGRLEEAREVLESVLGHEDMGGVPILVLANKQDREDSLEVVRIKEGFVRKVFEGEKGGLVRDSRVLPVSALKGTGVREAVDWIKSRVIWNKEGRPPVMR